MVDRELTFGDILIRRLWPSRHDPGVRKFLRKLIYNARKWRDTECI